MTEGKLRLEAAVKLIFSARGLASGQKWTGLVSASIQRSDRIFGIYSRARK